MSKVRVKMEFTIRCTGDVQLPELFPARPFVDAGAAIVNNLGLDEDKDAAFLILGGKHGRKWEMRLIDDDSHGKCVLRAGHDSKTAEAAKDELGIVIMKED